MKVKKEKEIILPDKQIVLVQLCMREFINEGIGNFQAFCNVWEKFNISAIHSCVSPRARVYSPFQAAVSTFLGFLHSNPTLLTLKGTTFGLYLIYQTQPFSIPYPLLINPMDLYILINSLLEETESLSILKFLLNHNALAFSCQLMSNISIPGYPSLGVVDDGVPFSAIENKSKPFLIDPLSNPLSEQFSKGLIEQIKSQYKSVLDSI